ncbi:MAG: TolC family protein, partial [Saprospiraceae bacterium]|nr:TolC family protein [Saprospiraceae bacterium]
NLALYEDFLEVTTTQLESGETGKIPQLAARSRLGNAQLALEHAEEQYDVARILFNQWLRSDTVFTADGEMEAIPEDLIDTSLHQNPHLSVHEALVQRAEADVARERAYRIPQIRSGLALQTASDLFPLFGYQIGVQVPLFKKAYRRHIEAAQLRVEVESAAMEAKVNEIDRKLSELRYRLQHLLHIITYLEDDLQPILDEQQTVNRAAYLEGEIGYLEMLDTLQQEVQVRRQLLDALYEFNVLRLELDYWSGQ